jgi:hypothetical protein
VLAWDSPGCCRRLVGNRVFRKRLAGVLDEPLPFLWNIKSDDRGIADGFSVPATTREHFRRAGSESGRATNRPAMKLEMRMPGSDICA